MLYFATCIPGLQTVVKNLLKRNDPKIEIQNLSDGFLLFISKLNQEDVSNLPFLNNVFALIDQTRNFSLEKMVRTAINSDFQVRIQQLIKGKKVRLRFRIVDENQTVSISKVELAKLEHKLLGYKNISIDRSIAEYEIWLYKRRESGCYIGLRLPKPGNYEKEQDKGELSPELTYMLSYLSEPTPGDVFLDPFCGSGAIPLQRARSFDYSRIIATDISIAKIKVKFDGSKIPRDFELDQADARDLVDIPASSVNKIVTDPPWGIYEKFSDIEDFYRSFLNSFFRVLKNNGLLVVLTAQKELFEKIITENNTLWKTLIKYDILVSGKKAGIFKLQKINSNQ